MHNYFFFLYFLRRQLNIQLIFSNELKSDNQQTLEDVKDKIIMSESACSYDIHFDKLSVLLYYE